MRSPAFLSRAAVLAAALAYLAAPAPVARGQAPKTEAKAVKSRLKLTVPQADAELTIEGKATKTQGTSREFETPDLEAGKSFQYTFVVKWRPNNYTELTRTKSVTFKAGDPVVVDLTKDEGNERAKIRWVPTPDDIVAQMIKLGGVKKDDVVFEPGPGDGRVLIACAKAGAKKAFGVDIDPAKVEEAKAAVKAAGLTDKVEVRLGDALDVKDMGDATVVMLYMGNEFNMLLRPILWKQLKPGTRIVSHRFTMGDWAPDKTVTVNGEDGDEYELHLWTVTDAVKKRADEKKPEEKKDEKKGEEKKG
jgi:uncharacterized protein (TIGR03000 family)